MGKHTFEIIAVGELKPDFVSSRIQKWIGANYSHVGILVDGVTVYHATGKGFHREHLLEMLPGCTIRHRIPFELSGYEAGFALGWLEGCIGTPYSHKQYVGFFLKALGEKMPIFSRPCMWAKRFFDNGRKYTICSEAVAEFMVDCLGASDPRLLRSDFICPRDAVEIAYEHTKKVTAR